MDGTRGFTRLGSVAIAATLGALLAIAGAAGAEIYRYVDAQGEMQLVSDLEMVPAEYREVALSDAEERSGGTLNIVERANDAPPVSAAPPAIDSNATTPGSATYPIPDEIGGHDEFWWRSQARELQEKIDDLTSELEEARAEEEDFSDQIYRRPNAGPGKAKGPARHRRSNHEALLLSAADDTDEPSIEELEEWAADAESDLQAFHDQARQAEVPPGWMR